MKCILVCLCFYAVFYFLYAMDAFSIQQHQHDDDLESATEEPADYNQDVNPKFRPWFEVIRKKNRTQTSPILEYDMPLIELDQPNENTTKSLITIIFRRTTSTRPGNFFQRQLRAFFGYRRNRNSSATRSNIKTGLR